jgi:pheromone shutdown protein TraB
MSFDSDARIIILGTAHVFRLEQRIRAIVRSISPQAVGVELDEKRFEALIYGGVSTHPLAFVQEVMASLYGTFPGNDMLGGIEGANDVNARLFLIDKDIEEINQKLMRALAFEFFTPAGILRKLTAFPFVSFPHFVLEVDPAGREFEKSLNRYRRAMTRMFPRFKRVLFDERERYMAKRIREISEEFDPVLAVVGAGHLYALKKLLPEFYVRAISLEELLRVHDI